MKKRLVVFEHLNKMNHTVEIQKFSKTTYRVDCPSIRETEYVNCENIWRCRIGRSNNWHYGCSFIEAVTKAIEESESHESSN